MQQGFGIILLAEEVMRARRQAALDIARARHEASRRDETARRPAGTPERRWSVRFPRLGVTLTVTRTAGPAGAR